MKKTNNMKDLDWSNLSFGYIPTDYNVRCCYRDGKWGEIEVCSDEYIHMHMAATCLHYGQEAFEGLKAYRCPDGKVRAFRMDENAARLQSTCRGILMPEVPTELFEEMVKKVVRLNQAYIPTYESGATLYIRPLLLGMSAQVGVHPATEYMFLIFVTPVGPYFKGGFATNPYVIIREYDRSAPLGTGRYKVGGNYAASLYANKMAHDMGYACEFYLDAKEKKYIDECGAANFFGIKDNKYITPKSTSILPSITNKSLMQLAEDMGMTVERRQIPEEELATFEEAGACGTAAVISPISKIDDYENNKSYVISKDGKPGPICTKLYNKIRGIQYGTEPDVHGWTKVIID
ncbi:MAG: branched-chain amino acid aminotransferase [Prevotellaceae bacterium]|nr:branched-chain amino acid aminotransferase [Prevotellaceae bacterium]